MEDGSQNSTTTDQAIETTSDSTDNSKPTNYMSLISIGVVVGVIVLIGLIIWVIWRKVFKSPRQKHGSEVLEAKANGIKKKDFFDQFNVNEYHNANSRTPAEKWEVNETAGSPPTEVSKLNGQLKEVKIGSGKRVFTVNKVADMNGGINTNNGELVIKIPKQFNELAQSLQSGDAKNFTLAVIDKHSNTIHNIDMRKYRLCKTPQTHNAMPNGQRMRRSESAKHPKTRQSPDILVEADSKEELALPTIQKSPTRVSFKDSPPICDKENPVSDNNSNNKENICNGDTQCLDLLSLTPPALTKPLSVNQFSTGDYLDNLESHRLI